MVAHVTADPGNERALWLALNVLPYEAALRAWLGQKYGAAIEIDDIVQDTYAALSALESVDHIRNPRSYAFRTAYSLILAQFDRAKVVSIRPAADRELENALGSFPTPEQIAEDRDELRSVNRVLGQLPEKVRRVFLLRRVQGLSQREISVRLGISENVVEKHVAKGVRLLMEAFGRGGKQPVRPLNRCVSVPDGSSGWEAQDDTKRILSKAVRESDRRK